VRWFEFGTFCPIFRAHGTRTTNQNEIWSYGSEAQKVLVAYDKLRYRLMPYIYSVAWKVTNEGYTMMRPLVMDFRPDVRAQNVGDEYLFGPAVLVAPVYEPGTATKHLYLPKAKWYDFWTGKMWDGGRTIDIAAPLGVMPLFVRGGSIVPLGPDIEFVSQKSADPIELRVYRGADGDFTLYEDQGDTYNYEHGTYSTIAFHWEETKQALTIGDRHGQFPGMLESRTFRVVFVGDNHGGGASPTEKVDKVVQFRGQQLTVTP
jgi:alpha-D-xyloside xylohydrolase